MAAIGEAFIVAIPEQLTVLVFDAVYLAGFAERAKKVEIKCNLKKIFYDS